MSDAPQPRVPDAPGPRVPNAPQPSVHDTPQPRVPDAPEPRVPDAPEPRVPDAPHPWVFQAVQEIVKYIYYVLVTQSLLIFFYITELTVCRLGQGFESKLCLT